MAKPILDDERRRELPPHEETNPLMGDEGGAGFSGGGTPSASSGGSHDAPVPIPRPGDGARVVETSKGPLEPRRPVLD